MNELETLLNALIARGRSPRNKEKVALISIVGEQLRLLEAGWAIYTPYSPRLRELVSLESWLWQFCMANGLCKGDIYERIEGNPHILGAGASYQSDRDCQYRLLESALVPEEELAQFLIDNIKTEN